MDKETWQENIEAYLEGELTGEALNNFEAALKTNATLKEDLELTRKVNKAFHHQQLEGDFKLKLKSLGKKYVLSEENTIEKNTPTPNQQSLTSNRRWFVLLLIVFIGIAGLYWVMKPTDVQESTSSEQIFANHFTPISLNEVRRGENTTTEDDYEKAVVAYGEQNYEAAISAFEAKLTTEPDNIPNQILLSNAYLSTNNSEKAVTLLESLSTDESHLFTAEAQWYLALAYLEMEQKASALPLLEKLSAKGRGKYSQLATNLLENLR